MGHIAWGNRQLPGDRLDSVFVQVFVDKRHHHFGRRLSTAGEKSRRFGQDFIRLFQPTILEFQLLELGIMDEFYQSAYCWHLADTAGL